MDEAMIVSLKSIRLNRKTEKDVIVDAVAVSEQFCILGYHNPTQSNWKPTRWTATGHCMDNSPISDLDMNDPALAGVAVIVGKFHQRAESAKDARDSLVRLRPQHFQTASRHAAKITALLLS